MSKLHKSNGHQYLAQAGYYILDTDPNSKAFVLSQIPDVLTIGKNAFLINGSTFLVPTTDVLIELTDVFGNVVFSTPIKNYQEGLARVVSIEVYDDTPLGVGLITILGELATDFTGSAIPTQFQNKYNVKWQQPVLINPFKNNSTPIRLYQQPSINVNELFNSARTVTGSITTFNGTGSIIGTPAFFYTGSLKNNYAVVFAENNLAKEYVSGTFMTTINGTPYTSSVSNILNSSVLYLTTPYMISGVPAAFTNIGYTITYPTSSTYSYSPFNESFLQVILSNLTTFSGDLRRVKLFIKGTDTSVDYKLISDTLLDPTELLTTQSSGQLLYNYGYFVNQSTIDSFWTSSYSAY